MRRFGSPIGIDGKDDLLVIAKSGEKETPVGGLVVASKSGKSVLAAYSEKTGFLLLDKNSYVALDRDNYIHMTWNGDSTTPLALTVQVLRIHSRPRRWAVLYNLYSL